MAKLLTGSKEALSVIRGRAKDGRDEAWGALTILFYYRI